jgi:hypothetical protein
MREKISRPARLIVLLVAGLLAWGLVIAIVVFVASLIR